MYYLNTNSPIIQFKKALQNKIYVDKSKLIHKLNEIVGIGDCYVCITRPRRFGKTINANMLGAYYTKGYDSHYIFDDLHIAKTENYETHINQHHVIYIDFSRMPDECHNYSDYITDIRTNLRSDICEIYPELKGSRYSRLDVLLKNTKDSFIFILDEWDSIFYKDFMTEKDKQAYLEFLKGLLKDQPYVELAYMTVFFRLRSIPVVLNLTCS